MKRLSLLVTLSLFLAAAAADPEATPAAIRELGQINGQALACGQMAVAGQAKALMIRHAPKTRRYGGIFEEETNTAFLAQGKDTDRCPLPKDFAIRLEGLAKRLPGVLPGSPPAAER